MPAGSTSWASLRMAGSEEDSARANTDSAIAVTGEPSSSASCTVQRPVPFCPAASATMSMNGLPVLGSTWRSTCAVISIR